MSVRLNRRQLNEMGISDDLIGPGIKPGGNPKNRTAPQPVDASLARKLFRLQCEAHGLPEPIPEYQFAAPRKWRFDWLWEGWLALEIQGGLWVNGRHNRGEALRDEYAKLNEAQMLGYVVLLVPTEDVTSGAAFALVKRALEECEHA